MSSVELKRLFPNKKVRGKSMNENSFVNSLLSTKQIN